VLLLCSTPNDPLHSQPENTFQQQWPNRNQAAPTLASRPLSSADETGPVTKRLRSTSRQADALKATKAIKSDEPLKKARPVLKIANFFSSNGRPSQPASRTALGAAGKTSHPANLPVAVRRSTRLLTGTGNKPTHVSKVSMLSS